MHVTDRPGAWKESITRWRAHGTMQAARAALHHDIYTRDSWVNENEKIAKGKSVIVRLN
jgi:hypothetical protein